MKNDAERPFNFSVVIIGRNEGDRLVRCIESVQRARYPSGDREIIYVDSASTDGSAQRAEALGVRVIILDGRPTAARGRNAGWRAARFPFVLFLDGDTILHPDFVRTARFSFDVPRVAAVFGDLQELHPEDSIYNEVLNLDWMSRPGPAAYFGGNALVRRAAIEEVGGLDESLIAGEEPEMCRRLREKGHVILHLDVPMAGHDLAIHRWGQYWRRAIRSGYAYAEVASRFRRTADPFWTRESRKSAVLGSFWIVSFVLIVAMALSRHWTLVAAGLLSFIAIVLRSAWRARWRTRKVGVLLLYAFHSHFAHIPIFIGEIAYWRGRSIGTPRTLIEYKDHGGHLG